ncbi:MAG: IS1-like element transposase [Endozoicomonas sp. (ex Botrylloides leachii)]|nr:IS1-like element transposase [Endozoicomonas sp. (ex Botrylloides leachii)]
MAIIKVSRSHCESDRVVKNGKAPSGLQRFYCKNCRKRFQKDFIYNGNQPGVQDRLIDMAMNGSGVRDTSRVLGISQNTVIERLKNSHPDK